MCYTIYKALHHYAMHWWVYLSRPYIPVYMAGIQSINQNLYSALQDPYSEALVLHWLPFPQCTSYRIASLVWLCLSDWVSSHLHEFCHSLSLSLSSLCRPLYTGPLCVAIWCSHLPALRHRRAIPFLWLVQQPGWASLGSDASPKWCLFSVSPAFEDFCSTWPESRGPLSRDPEVVLYKLLSID